MKNSVEIVKCLNRRRHVNVKRLLSTELAGYKPRSPLHVYMECPSDVTSCRDVATSHVTSYQHYESRKQKAEHQRRGDCVAGVYCEAELYEDDHGLCRPLQQCPCYDSGSAYQPGDVIHRSCADW